MLTMLMKSDLQIISSVFFFFPAVNRIKEHVDCLAL